MSSGKGEPNQAKGASCVNMESVQRITKLPVVESTINTASSLYGKVKDYNCVTNWTLQTAENTVNKAVEVGKPIATPVVKNLEGPIKTVDGYICSGLDYVEAKVPAVKLPPAEILLQIYNSTKELVTPVVESACAYVKPSVDTAKKMVEPAIESAKVAVEPYVQPALEKASALKDYGAQKVDQFLYHAREAETASARSREEEDEAAECAECQENSEKLKR